MADEFKYWGFISYSHADESFVRKLHLSLERYALPRRLRKAHALPRRLIPVFRDVEELEAASALTNRLQEALDQSRWLIVLCTPAAAKSKYVNAEIEYFIGKHGARRVLCALVEGEPADSFPPAIKALKDEPLASDFRPGRDFELGRLKLIAAMAVVGFTELRNREAQRRKRQRLAIAAGIGAIGAIALAYWDLFVREQVDFYVSFIRKNGIWQGVDKISADRADRRSASYRFIRRGRLHPPDRVDYFHGCAGWDRGGFPDLLGNWRGINYYIGAYCSASFRYHGDGSVAQESLLSMRGVPLETLAYTGDGLAQFLYQGYASANGHGGVNYVQFARDARGFDVTVRFLHSKGEPRPNNDHAFGYAYAYDDNGRVQRKSALDETGAESGNITQYVYDEHGFAIAEQRLDLQNGPQAGTDGCVRLRSEYDDDGNLLTQICLDAQDRPTATVDGFARIAYLLDARGNWTEQRLLDVQNKPATGRDGISIRRAAYDTRGFMIHNETRDAQGRLVANSEGFAASDLENDEFGQVIRSRFYDAAGKPPQRLAAIVRHDYDERGFQSANALFDANGKPSLPGTFGSVVKFVMDERGNLLRQYDVDTQGKAYVRPDVGCAGWGYRYDERGTEIEKTCLGADLKPVTGKKGWAYQALVHDDFGNLVEQRYLDTEHRLRMPSGDVAVTRSKFDHAGNEIERRYFGPDNQPVKAADGSYGWNAQYDHSAHQIAKVAVAAGDSPVKPPK